ncbi:MAG: response regulator [Verrucomicrobiota bacterium]
MNTFPPSGSSKRILVVEDEKPMRDVLEIALGTGGFQVITAIDGSEAMSLARLMHFDLVIADMVMPGIAGIETIMSLLAYDPGMKIIAMSGALPGAKGDFLPLAKSLGAAAVLRKPFDRESFIGTVHGVLEHNERRMVG